MSRSSSVRASVAALLLAAAVGAPSGNVVAAGQVTAVSDDTTPPAFTEFSVEDDRVEDGILLDVVVEVSEETTGGSTINDLLVTFDGRQQFWDRLSGGFGEQTFRIAVDPHASPAGIRPFCVTATDGAGNRAQECRDITVVPYESPLVTAELSASTVGMHDQLMLHGTVDDAATGDSPITGVSWHVPNQPIAGEVDVTGTDVVVVFDVSLTAPGKPGQYEVCVFGHDNSGAESGSDCADLTVIDDLGPHVGSSTLAPFIPAFAPVTFAATVSDDFAGKSAIASATVSVDDGPSVEMIPDDGSFDSPNETVTGTLPPMNSGNHDVCITATDVAGNASSPSCRLVTATEYDAPSVTAIDTPAQTVAGEPFTLTATLDDSPSGNSTITGGTVLVDGSTHRFLTAADGMFDTATEVVTASVLLDQPGTVDVCVTARDLHTTSDPVCVVVEVLPRSASGSGSISSLVPLLTDNATFEFDVTEGDDATGEGTFTFADALMTFEASSIDAFYVVDSTTVLFHGTGLRNGIEECDFTVTATEGDAPGGTFGVHLACTTNQYAASADYHRSPPEGLLDGTVTVHGNS